MKKQFGRSMIEILGVLAIIGVLSIGGIVMYRRTVTKYLANHIIDDVNLSGFLVMDDVFNRLPDDDVGLDLTGRFDQKSSYTFKAFAETETSFELLVTGVPYPVCQELMERDLNDYDEVRANRLTTDECLSTGDNEISFFFDSDQSDRCSQDSDCGHCSHCVKNRCQYGFTDRSGNNCFDCNDVRRDIYNIDKEECHRCKNRIWGHSYTDGRCLLPLNKKNTFWDAVSKEECERHTNHYSTNGGGSCLYCEGIFDPSTGVCNSSDCEPGSGHHTIYGLDEATCTQCGGNFLSGNMKDNGEWISDKWTGCFNIP